MNTRKLKHGPGGAGVSECGGGIRGAETRPAGQEASSSRCWCLWGRAMYDGDPSASVGKTRQLGSAAAAGRNCLGRGEVGLPGRGSQEQETGREE